MSTSQQTKVHISIANFKEHKKENFCMKSDQKYVSYVQISNEMCQK